MKIVKVVNFMKKKLANILCLLFYWLGDISCNIYDFVYEKLPWEIQESDLSARFLYPFWLIYSKSMKVSVGINDKFELNVWE